MTALEALNLAAPLADTYTEVEQRLLVKIARQLTLNDTHSLNEVSKWQIKQLAQMGMLKKDAAKIINSMTKGLPADYADTIQAAIEATLAEDGLTSMWENEEFSESAKKAVKHYRNQAADVYNQVNTVMQYKAGSSYVKAVNSVAEKMSEEMRRLQKEVGNKQTFLDTLNSNTAAVVSGTTARTKAVRDTIHEMVKKGIPAFVDKLGREWSPEAYVNMDIRNTVKNTATDAAFGAMDALGQDVFEVSSHPGSRPKCRPWQGKFISKSGRTTEIRDLNGRKYKVYPLSQTSYGEPDGLFGINCGHRPRGVSDGLFTKTSKTSEEYGADDEELYYKVCKQREMERKVRKSKTEADMLEAAGDAEGAKAVRQKAAQYNKELKGYCQQNGLKYRTDGVRTYGRVKPEPKHMSANNNSWVGAEPIVHSAAELDELNKYATDKGIKLYRRKPFDGDMELLKAQIDTVAEIREEFHITDPVQIGWKRMDADDFGETSQNHQQIWINDVALRNRSVTEKNLVSDNYLACDIAEGIAAHEMGHVISGKIRNGKTGLDIYKQTVYNVSGKQISDREALVLLAENVSEYSASVTQRSNGTNICNEIIPEMVSVYRTKPNKYAIEFIRLLKEACGI